MEEDKKRPGQSGIPSKPTVMKRNPKDIRPTETGNGAKPTVEEPNQPSFPAKTIILAKPPPRKVVEDDEEEWPTVGTTSIRSRSGTPAQLATVQRPIVPAGRGIRPQRAIETADIEVLRGKTVGRETSTAYQIQKPTESGTVGAVSTDAKQMKSGVKLVNEFSEWCDIQMFLNEQNPEFLVVGVLGQQGAGKSTFLSMLSGNSGYDLYRNYTYRPASKEAVESSCHQTNGIHFFVTDERMILLDTQPVLSASVLAMMIDKKYSLEYAMPENCEEVQALEMATFLMQVCHVIVVVIDWFVDVNLLRFIQTAEMLKPTAPVGSSDSSLNDQFPRLIFVQNRSQRDDFNALSIRNKCKTIGKVFANSRLNFRGDMSMSEAGMFLEAKTLGSPVNFYLLPDLPDIKVKQTKGPKGSAEFRNIPDYDYLMERLRAQLLAVPRHQLCSTVTGEKSWSAFAAKTWDSVVKSSVLAEYGRLLP